MFPQWEISYQALDYKPVCGVSAEKEGSDYWSNSPECEPAMATFNSSAGQAQKYDTSGIVSADAIGRGTRLCLCYTVWYTPKAGQLLDICLLVGSAGQVLISKGVAVGLQSPETNRAKALPQCKDYQPAASSPAPGPDSTTSLTPSRTLWEDTVPTTSSSARDSDGTRADNNAGSADSGLSKEAIIALATGIPGAVVAVATIIIYWRRRMS